MTRLLLPFVLAAVLAGTAAPTAAAKEPCGWSGYSYAGVAGKDRAHGVAATLSMLSLPRVESGHVAAWIGVGGAGLGRGGADVWLQVGLSGFADGRAELYYEVAQPRAEPRYVTLDADVRRGERFRVSVVHLRARPGTWRVFVNGRAASPPLALPGSARGWQATATAETWDGGAPACNRFSYRFGDLRAADVSRRWRPLSDAYVLEDPGYAVRRTAGAFVATARR